MSIARRGTTMLVTGGSLSRGSEGITARAVTRYRGRRSRQVRGTALAASMVLLLSSCWRQIGADGGQTRFNPVELELNWANAATLREAWSVDVQGDLSEPIVFDGRAYLTRNSAVTVANPTISNPEADVLAWDVETGATLWQEQLASSQAGGARITGTAVSLVDDELWGGHIVIEPGSAGSACETASVVFDPETGERTMVGTTAPGPTASADGVTARFLRSCSEPFLLEVDSRRPDGSGSHWTAPVDNQQLVPTLGREHVYAQVRGDVNLNLAAFDIDGCGAATCEPDWEFYVGGGAEGVAAAPYGPLFVLQGSSLTALDQATGNQLWDAQVAPWDGEATGLAVASGIVYVTTTTQLLAYSASGCWWSPTCSPLWSAPFPPGVGASKPVVGGGVVYVATGNGISNDGASVLAFAAGGCWAEICSPIATVPLDSVVPTYAELSLSEGHLFVAASTVVFGGQGGFVELARGRLIALAPA